MKIATVTTLKASLSNTLSFVHYHLNTGIDHLYLFFDDPSDKAISVLENNPGVTAIPCTEMHWQNNGCSSKSDIEIRQACNSKLALSWCRDEGIEWIAHIDSDELIYAHNTTIKTILASLDDSIDYLLMPPFEAIPNKMECVNPFIELKQFKILIRDEESLQSLPYKERVLYRGEFLRGHLGGKSFTRIHNNISHLNIHRPTSESISLVEERHEAALLLHYDCYDYHNWLTKWTRRYDGTASFSGRENRNNQFDDFCSTLEDKDEALRDLYKTMYLLPPDIVKELKQCNVVREINLDKPLFDKPPIIK